MLVYVYMCSYNLLLLIYKYICKYIKNFIYKYIKKLYYRVFLDFFDKMQMFYLKQYI